MSLAKRTNAGEGRMNVQRITTIASPQNISFKKFEHNEELFKKADEPIGEENKKWTHRLYKPLHHI